MRDSSLNLRSFLLCGSLLVFANPVYSQLSSTRADAGCIDVSAVDAKVTVSGRLTRATFRDDHYSKTQHAFIIQLPSAICIDDGGDFADSSQHFTNVHVAGRNAPMIARLKKFVGRAVSVTGNGFAAHTRHHRAPLVVLIDQLEVR
jgi:hypothetical protein